MNGIPAARTTIQDHTAVAISVALAVITLGLYAPVLGHDFIDFDDGAYVTANPMVQQGWNGQSFAWAWTTGHAANWHPLTWLSHITDCALFGLEPAGHHAINVLLHAANTVLLFLLLRRMTGDVWRPAIVSALFGWHPLHVESVAWVAERKDVLSTFFFLLTIWAYARYVAEFKVQSSKFKVFYGLSLVFFVCALLSKPMVVTLPFVLLLLDFWPLQRFGRGVGARLVVEKMPFFALSAASCAATYWVQRSAGAVTQFIPLLYRAENAVLSYWRYLGRMIWPAHLAVVYPYSKVPPRWDVALFGLLLLAAITWLAFKYRQQRYLAVGWLWYLGTLVPVIGLVQAGQQSSADRYTYIPLIGIFLAIVWGGAKLAAKWQIRPWVTTLLAGLVLTACAAATEVQLSYWTDSGTLFRRTLAVTKDNEVAWNSLGVYLLTQQQEKEAVESFAKSVAIAPDYEPALYNMGAYCWRHGRNEEALHYFTESLRFRERPTTCYHVGLALMALHRRSEAVPYFAKAVAFGPNFIPARMSLADGLSESGNNKEAALQYREVLRRDPSQADARCDLALILAGQGQTAEAVEELEEALRLRPSDASAHCNLGNLFMEQGKTDMAAVEYRAALRLRPGSPEIHCNLGAALALQGQKQQAMDEFHEALRLAPNFTQAKERLNALKGQ